MSDCPDCWKEQRSMRDIFLQTKADGQKFSQAEKSKVAIIQQGCSFSYEAFTKAIPAGTIEIIIPVQ